jgi:radical SAM protein with 4Fe4S-binding SPASM domain
MGIPTRYFAPLSRLWGHFKLQPVAHPGLYHFERDNHFGSSRIHLRIDGDYSGLLLVNANRIVHLNSSAAMMAWLYLNKTPTSKAIKAIQQSFQVSQPQATSDYTAFTAQLSELVKPDGACPIHDLNLDIIPPFSTKPSAPYRMDLAVTYQCNNDCHHCYNARSRDFQQISTQQWKTIIDNLWGVGIPHIVFTGGEPTLRKDLPELIAHAEKNGQITGLNTNGRRLSDKQYLQELVDAGLDHIQVTVESHDPNIHDRMVAARGAFQQTIKGLNNVLETPLHVMTNTTLLRDNSPYLRETLNYFGFIGVPTIGLNALIYSGKGASVGTGLSEFELPQLLEVAQAITQENDQRLIWYTPTQYCNFDPMKLELGIKGCTAALYNMCIEPNGDVIPCQSFYQSVGNLLTDPWGPIWNHKLCQSLRNRDYLPEKCNGCVLMQECGGGCPLQYMKDQNTLTRLTRSSDEV